MALNYAWEKLYSAVLYAMRSTDSLQGRLEAGYASFHTLAHGDHLPSDLKKRFDEMMKALTLYSDATGVRGRVAVTVEKMGDAEARQWLAEVLTIYNEVVRRERWKDARFKTRQKADNFRSPAVRASRIVRGRRFV